MRDWQIVVVCARSECGAVVRQLEQILAETEGAVGKTERSETARGVATRQQRETKNEHKRKETRRRTQPRLALVGSLMLMPVPPCF